MGDFELTKELIANNHNKILQSFVVNDDVSGINMSNSGKKLRCVIKIGNIDDWCLYIHFASYSKEEVARFGDKVIGEDNIKKYIDMSDEVFKMYRY